MLCHIDIKIILNNPSFEVMKQASPHVHIKTSEGSQCHSDYELSIFDIQYHDVILHVGNEPQVR